ncbi:hypothetical protein HYPSUDRAFT_208399 [Hypholoma sublateritium FD-334 SS-4]|uniref:Uncharacterized protein n=1 Tax=Hypholoma sublateritium (strain FD-334 SS-4) TaxID=945553 RepID=A0A0D2N6V7_HYPSF|nr:hypothetical protein HYPSUDRAFT_208399 [Hypholoma sublateritium FD-334 SS-4]
MDSIRGPSPVPSDGNFPSSNYSLTGSLPGSGSAALTSYSTAQHRQMPWSSSSTESSWSNASLGNALIPSSQYHQLHARFNELQRENTSLLTKNAALESKVDTLIQSWNSVSQAQVIEIGEEAGEAFPELEEEEEGSKQPLPSGRGKRRAAQGINVTMKYVELEDGTIIDGFRAAEIRRYARSLWVQMALDDKLPATWSDADAASLTYYSESMAQRFMEMRLCASDWKANLVATDNYPSWRHNWLKKKNKESKRPSETHTEDNSVPMKKLKVLSNDEDAPLSLPKPIGSSDVVAPLPLIHIIPGTPLQRQQIPIPLSSQSHEGDQITKLQPGPPYSLNFMVGNPLAAFQQHQPEEEFNTPQGRVPVTDTSKSTEWVKQHPHGTTDDFKSYYDNLIEEQRQIWEDKSKAISQNQ